MEESYLLSTPTLKAFVKGVEDSLLLLRDKRVGIICLEFYPRFYFLSYSMAAEGSTSKGVVRKYLRQEEFMGNGDLRQARQGSRLKAVENALDLPLRKAGFLLSASNSTPIGDKEPLTKVTWYIAPLQSKTT